LCARTLLNLEFKSRAGVIINFCSTNMDVRQDIPNTQTSKAYGETSCRFTVGAVIRAETFEDCGLSNNGDEGAGDVFSTLWHSARGGGWRKFAGVSRPAPPPPPPPPPHPHPTPKHHTLKTLKAWANKCRTMWLWLVWVGFFFFFWEGLVGWFFVLGFFGFFFGVWVVGVGGLDLLWGACPRKDPETGELIEERGKLPYLTLVELTRPPPPPTPPPHPVRVFPSLAQNCYPQPRRGVVGPHPPPAPPQWPFFRRVTNFFDRATFHSDPRQRSGVESPSSWIAPLRTAGSSILVFWIGAKFRNHFFGEQFSYYRWFVPQNSMPGWVPWGFVSGFVPSPPLVFFFCYVLTARSPPEKICSRSLPELVFSETHRPRPSLVFVFFFFLFGPKWGFFFFFFPRAAAPIKGFRPGSAGPPASPWGGAFFCRGFFCFFPRLFWLLCVLPPILFVVFVPHMLTVARRLTLGSFCDRRKKAQRKLEKGGAVCTRPSPPRRSGTHENDTSAMCRMDPRSRAGGGGGGGGWGKKRSAAAG